ncbi:MAG: hypothetical protein WD182_09370, partial [Bacteroidota bacterium]
MKNPAAFVLAGGEYDRQVGFSTLPDVLRCTPHPQTLVGTEGSRQSRQRAAGHTKRETAGLRSDKKDRNSACPPLVTRSRKRLWARRDPANPAKERR